MCTDAVWPQMSQGLLSMAHSQARFRGVTKPDQLPDRAAALLSSSITLVSSFESTSQPSFTLNG